MLELNQIYNIDCLKGLKQLPDESIDCVVTSPPYWGLRSYGEEAVTIWDSDPNCQHEWTNKTIVEIISNYNQGFNERWNNSPGQRKQEQSRPTKISYGQYCTKCSAWKGQLGLEPTFYKYIEHLIAIFDEVKRVLKPTGTCWVNLGDTYGQSGGCGSQYGKHRLEILGMKKYGGRSVKGMEKSLCLIPFRFAIEMVDRGWRLRNTIIWKKPNAMPQSVKDRFTVDFEYVFFFVKNKNYYFEQQFEPLKEESKKRAMRGNRQNKYSTEDYLPYGVHANTMSKPRPYLGYENMDQLILEGKTILNPKGRNKRCVWSIPTKPFKGDHFAVYPPALIEPMILAGCPENGIVLDPFIGSGTTAVVAKKLNRNYIGFEVNSDYVNIAQKRIVECK